MAKPRLWPVAGFCRDRPAADRQQLCRERNPAVHHRQKNWLFCHAVAGANASASLYSLVETAKANDIETFANLGNLFPELPQATSVDEIAALLPEPDDVEEPAQVL